MTVSNAPAGVATPNTPRRWRTTDPSETLLVGEELARELLPDGVLLLYADLGVGKTVLARGVASALGVDPDDVQSPTYTLIREHRGSRGAFVHVDLYRLEPAAVADLGLEELLSGTGVKVVEWAERLPFEVPGASRLALTRRLDSLGRHQVEIVELSTDPGR